MSYFDINKVNYEGPKSNNAFSFKYYNPEEKLGNHSMSELLRFSVAYWHNIYR